MRAIWPKKHIIAQVIGPFIQHPEFILRIAVLVLTEGLEIQPALSCLVL